MKILNKQQKGQTLIETALILILLMLILFGITEFARAWYTKNSLKNAARQGARVAVVTTGITDGATDIKSLTPPNCDLLSGDSKVFCHIWKSPGIKNGSTATINIEDLNSTRIVPDAGDTVRITIDMDYQPLVPGFMRSFIPSEFHADAAMRYEMNYE